MYKSTNYIQNSEFSGKQENYADSRRVGAHCTQSTYKKKKKKKSGPRLGVHSFVQLNKKAVNGCGLFRICQSQKL